MTESFEGQLHDEALTNIVIAMHDDTKDVAWADLSEEKKTELNEQAQEMYLACALISPREIKLLLLPSKQPF